MKVYQLHIGQPDVETPDTFFEGLNNYKEKIVKYTNHVLLRYPLSIPSLPL